MSVVLQTANDTEINRKSILPSQVVKCEDNSHVLMKDVINVLVSCSWFHCPYKKYRDVSCTSVPITTLLVSKPLVFVPDDTDTHHAVAWLP